MTTAEKVAYLKGLAEGLGVDPAAKEGKLLNTIIDILEDLALDVEDLGDSIDELSEGLDVISEDLEDVEDIVFDEGELEKIEDDDLDEDEEDEELDTDDLVLYECVCPSCGESVTFEESVLEQGGIQCPVCGESLEFELEGDEDEKAPEEG